VGPGRRVPGLKDLGALVRFHEKIYWKEYRYDRRFGAYVAKGLAGMVLRYDSARDRLWLAKSGGRIIGSIAIVRHSRTSAQLRWFLVAPGHRGKGLGKGLMNEALRFARSAGYRTVFLWTTSELDAARHVYEGAGFRRTARMTHDVWGRRNITEERYSLKLR
jgi:GNAT superfamily N-acetyltransferase